MRYFFTFFCVVLLAYTSVYAKPVQGYKIVLNSFATFDDAKEALDVTGKNLTKAQVDLLEKYHCSLLARPSGKGYIVVIEPFEQKKEAIRVAKEFKAAFLDAYISGYFGPTKNSVFWKSKELIVSDIDAINSTLPTPCAPQISPSLPKKESPFLVWPIVVGMLALAGALFALILTIKKQKMSKPRPPHRDINAHKPHSKKEEEIPLNLWEYDVALHRTGGDEELLEERMQAFVSKAPATIGRLKEVVLNKEWDNIIAYTCSLKSLSADIAAGPLRIMSRRLEGAAREYNSDIVATTISKCESILNDTMTSLKKHIAREEVVKTTAQSHLGTGDIDTLEILRTYLEKSLFVDTDKASVLNSYPHGELAYKIKELKSTINRLDYRKALELLGHIEGALQ
jgi:hypothetical protein